MGEWILLYFDGHTKVDLYGDDVHFYRERYDGRVERITMKLDALKEIVDRAMRIREKGGE